jgi:hypothetical protein
VIPPSLSPACLLLLVPVQHSSKQAEWQRPLVRALQNTLRETQLGAWFFSQIANQKVTGCLSGFMVV